MSPYRRPIDNSKELHKSHRKESQPSIAIIRPTKTNNSTTKIKPISQPTPPLPRIATAGSGSRSNRSSSAPKPTAIELGQQNFHPNYSSPALNDLHLPDWLQRVCIYGKDLANIILGGNSIYESIEKDTKEGRSFQSNNDSRMLQIYKEIASHRQGNTSVTSYFTKLKALWDELATFNTDLPQCSCGGAIDKLSEHIEREKVMQFLVGLNDSYSTICNQILRTKPFPTVEKAYSAIIQEEKRKTLVVGLENVMKKVQV